MPVVMILVALAILAGVFVAATGRGGEMAYEQADHAPLDLGPVSATEVAALRPPTAMWGYNMQVTDEALERIAQALRDRDVTIAYLQQRLTGTAPGPAPDQAPEHAPWAAPEHAPWAAPGQAVPGPPQAATGPDPVFHDPAYSDPAHPDSAFSNPAYPDSAYPDPAFSDPPPAARPAEPPASD